MAELGLLVSVLLAFLGRLDPSYGAVEDICAPTACQGGQLSIRFPYALKNMQSKSCGYPGFELSCDGNGNTVINLPSSGEFIVDFIHYGHQTIWLKDPNDCLPGRLQNFSEPGSTLKATNSRSFTFWNCSANSENMFSGLRHVGCLSGTGYNVMVLPTDELSGFDPHSVQGCLETWTINVPSVPKDWSSYRTIETFGLTWDLPDCRSCEQQHGTCGLRNKKSKDVICFSPDETKKRWKHSKWETIVVMMMTPGILLVAVSCYMSKKRKARDDPAALTSSASPDQGQRGQLTSPAIIVMDSSSSTLGVDSPTIASYPKIQITENVTKLLEPTDDNTCAICLLEYHVNDTMKIMPKCNHHFHDHCIDKWLRKRATCPLCREQQHRQQLQYE